MITTSNFTRWAKGRWKGGVSIARSTPSWVKVPWFEKLAPPQTLLDQFLAPIKAARTEAELLRLFSEYEAIYREIVLGDLDPVAVSAELKMLAPDGEPVLLCWCAKDGPCHRRIVADWLPEDVVER